MTCLISNESISTLKDGIETVLIPIRHPLDTKDLAFHAQRGGTYDVVEWLLSEFGRPSELERVCGLTVSPQPSIIVVTLEMRQPGKQVEEWLKSHRELQLFAAGGGDLLVATDGDKEVGRLSMRAMSHDKFTDLHHPWWEKELYACPFCASTDLEFRGERPKDKLHCNKCEADFGAGRKAVNGLVGLEVPAVEHGS